MFDGAARRYVDPVADRIGRSLARAGVSANQVTIAACAVGLLAAGAIALGHPLAGLVLILISRAGDALDGAVARASAKTDFGGFLDIVLDFLFYGAIPCAFVLADPAANGAAGGVLLLSFYFNGASFLAYSVMAEKRRLETTARGAKSLYFTTGLAEASETLLVFAAFCLWPAHFAPIAWVFAAICFYTALSRIVLARATFG